MSLYRKYRPQLFEEVVGQDHVAHTLRNALAATPPRLAHAYLFCGPRGTGKTTVARILAKALNCVQGPTPTPCNECDFCVRVRDNQPLLDLLEIDAASNTQVEKVREQIIEKVNMRPAMGRYRVYIIDEVHRLSGSAFDALLKTLEEPPAHAVFVLATTEASKVPATVASRCQRHDFRRVRQADIEKRLLEVAAGEGLELHPAAAHLMARSADGGMRDGLTLLEQVSAFAPGAIDEAAVRQVLGSVSGELLDDLLHALARQDAAAALAAIGQAVEEGASFGQVTHDLVAQSSELLHLAVGMPGRGSAAEIEERQRMAGQFGKARLLDLLQDLREAEGEMRQSQDHRLVLEIALLRSCQPVPAAAPAPSRVATAPAATVTPAASPARPAALVTVTAPADPVPVQAPEVPAPAPDALAAVEAPAAATPKKKARRIHNLQEFEELWPAVLVRMRRQIGSTGMVVLHDAYPVALTETDAVLEFSKEFPYRRACEAMRDHPYEQLLNECLDKSRRLRLQLAKTADTARPSPPPPPPVATPEVDTGDEDDIVKAAQHMFSAEIVESE